MEGRLLVFIACSIKIFVTLVSLSQFVPINALYECAKPNEIYIDCGCPATCENNTVIISGSSRWLINLDINCTKQNCISGCQCVNSYYNDGTGNCVPVEECPISKTCPENETFDLSINEHFCNKILKFEGDKSEEVQVSLVYSPGDFSTECICKSGYARDSFNNCITIKECPQYPPRCGDSRKEFLECGSPCPPSCDYLGKPSKCLNICVSACFCKPEYVLLPNGSCILPQECVANNDVGFLEFCNGPDKDFQDYVLCGPNNILPTCDQPIPTYNITRLECGDVHCLCKVGFILARDPDGGGNLRCVPDDICQDEKKIRTFLSRGGEINS